MKLAFVFLLSSLWLASFGQESSGQKQPVEFNHKIHVADLKQPCNLCHADTGSGEMVDMPEISNCMKCHASLAPKTAAERKLAAFAKQNRDIDWVRVYQIPTFVRFNHRQHTTAGAKCDTCHGAVATRASLWREREMTMGECMNCHRQTRASLDCGSCHEVR